MNREMTSYVTTSLVHRRDKSESPWWRSAVVCDLPGAFDNKDLKSLEGLFPKIAELGFDALLLRPAFSDTTTKLVRLPKFVQRAHKHGLNVIVRTFLDAPSGGLPPEASPPPLSLEHDFEELQTRVQGLLDAGVDGVDLGLILEPEGSPDLASDARAFTQAVQSHLAEVELAGNTAILTAGVITKPRESLLRHLTEEWFHHLRDDSLVNVPWNAHEIQANVMQAYGDRDPLGQTTAWRYSLPKWASSALIRSSADFGWAKSQDSPEREMAMMLYSLSLPGSVYVPLVHVGGSIRVTKRRNPELKFAYRRGKNAQFRAGIASDALRLRTKLDLGEENLAFVHGLPWASSKTAVHLCGSTLVVLNTGKKPVVVPEEYRPVASSAVLSHVSSEGTVVGPNTCVWFQMAPLEPVNPVAYR